MSFKKSKAQLSAEYNLAIDCARECGKETAKTENLHRFATQLGYLDAALIGGKITQDQALRQVKDLYKSWKETNKGIDLE